jgi:hypothetical protein
VGSSEETQIGPSSPSSESAEHQPSAERDVPTGLLALLSDPDVALGSITMPRIGADPPRELRVFTWGDNATTKGTLKLTPEGAQKLMDAYRARGVVKCFDYAHATYNAVADPAGRKAAGFFRPEIRSDGLWFVDIRWTPAAAQAIRDGEWPYVSPAVLHSRDGVILEVNNAGLVTDPGTIAATPLILSGSDSGAVRTDSLSKMRNVSMSDKKRMVLDAYAACESAMKRLQGLADTDSAEKDLGNRLTGHMVPVMDALRAHMSGAGYLEDLGSAQRSLAARDKMLATLEAELGESDPERLHGRLLARLLSGSAPAPAEGPRLTAEDEQSIRKLLLDGYRAKYPTAKRPALEALPLPGVVSYLSAAADIVPMGDAPREAAPLQPTSANVQSAVKDLPKPAGSSSGKPTTLAECSAQQRARVEQYLSASRLFQGAAFNEALETQHALTLLSDADESAVGNQIRHLPYTGDGAVNAEAF